jgi:hypothetical protein
MKEIYEDLIKVSKNSGNQFMDALIMCVCSRYQDACKTELCLHCMPYICQFFVFGLDAIFKGL